MLKIIYNTPFRILISGENKTICNTFITKVLSARTLYSQNTLGLDGYLAAREKVKSQFTLMEDKFRDKMREFSNNEPTNMVFTEDLKNMLHLSHNNIEDLELIVKMIKKFHSQNKELRFGTFKFGPVAMRAFYHLDAVDTALQCFQDQQLDGFFDQLISFQILMDMLYEKKRYDDALEVFRLVKSKQLQDGKYPRHVVVLAFACYFKIDTMASMESAKKLWHELHEVGHWPMRKAATFFAGLAYKQNSPHISLEVLSTLRDQHYLTVRNLKALAYCEMGRPDDALPILRSVLEIDQPGNKKHTFIRDVLIKIRESIEKQQKKEIESDFHRIERFLLDHGNITDQSLDEILCSEIDSVSTNTQKKERTFIAASFSKNQLYRNNFKLNQRTPRQGLKELN